MLRCLRWEQIAKVVKIVRSDSFWYERKTKDWRLVFKIALGIRLKNSEKYFKKFTFYSQNVPDMTKRKTVMTLKRQSSTVNTGKTGCNTHFRQCKNVKISSCPQSFHLHVQSEENSLFDYFFLLQHLVVRIHTFCKHLNFIWCCVFPVSILKALYWLQIGIYTG